ncbi:hypothetical protein K438DRAFT_184159 [Mycena galopus ATCC 62051]|nr:hypothetical protein K438DRAFT_184159 [Mycena galopus ATCC 62051]
MKIICYLRHHASVSCIGNCGLVCENLILDGGFVASLNDLGIRKSSNTESGFAGRSARPTTTTRLNPPTGVASKSRQQNQKVLERSHSQVQDTHL